MHSRCASIAAGIAILCLLALSVMSAEEGDAAYEDDLSSRLLSAAPGDVVIVERDCTVTKDLVVPANVTLLLPYSATDKTGYGTGSPSDNDRLNKDTPYITLTLDEDATISVYGKLAVGGIVGKDCYAYQYQCHTSGAHAELVNNGEIYILGGGSLDCYGYLSGNGLLDAASGTTVIEPVIITDHVDGDTLLNMLKSGQCPFNRYAFENITCTMVIHSGATLIGDGHIYAAKTLNHTSMKFIASENSLITLKDGATATFTHDASRYIDDPDYQNALGNDIGKTTVTINGGADFRAASLTLTISVPVIGTITDTESFDQTQFSFPYTFDYVLEDGTYSMREDFRILPGSNFTVCEDAHLTVYKKLYVYDGLVDIPWGNENTKKYYPTPELLEKYGYDTCGNLYVNGTMVINGSFRGTIQSQGGGYVSVGEKADVGAAEVEYGCDNSCKIIIITMDRTRNLTVRTMAGTLFGTDGNPFTMVPGTNYQTVPGTGYAHSFTQTNKIDGTTTTYHYDRAATGAWYVTDEPVPTPVENTYVDFEVFPEGDTLDLASIYLVLEISIRTYDFEPDQYPNVVADMSGYSSVTMTGEALRALTDYDCDLTMILADGTFRFSASLVYRLSDEDTVLSFIKGDSEFNDKQKETCSGLTTFSLSMSQGAESLHELGYNVEVSLPYVPEEGEDVEKLRIWYVDEEGGAYNYDAYLLDGKLIFRTSHFSSYAVSYSDPPTPSFENLDLTWIYVLIGVAVAVLIALIGGVAYIIRKRCKARRPTI